MNDNQNYFVTRSTSRVLSIPGGKCSIDIFGDDTNANSNTSSKNSQVTPAPKAEVVVQPTQQEKPASTHDAHDQAARNKHRAMAESFDLFGSDKPAKPTTAAQCTQAHETSTQESLLATGNVAGTNAVEKSLSSNQFASSATTNSYNVITSRPTSRVLQEPGGKSEDFIFG